MQKLIILGSAGAVSTQDRDSTHMVLSGAQRLVMIDAPGGNPLLRLEKAGLDFNQLSDVILTHFHMDHTLGVPLLLTNLWLLGRKRVLHIHGLEFTLDRLKRLMDLYDWSEFPGFFPVEFHVIPTGEMVPVIAAPDFSVHASTVCHSIPTIGLRMQFKPGGRTIAYSCDTRPCDEVVRLAAGANVLIHEAAGDFWGHSSAKQAGEIASRAGAGSLYLIHYSGSGQAASRLVAEARSTFQGDVCLAVDWLTLA